MVQGKSKGSALQLYMCLVREDCDALHNYFKGYKTQHCSSLLDVDFYLMINDIVFMSKHPFEHRSEPLLPFYAFVQRIVLSFFLGFGIIILSLAAGMAGYHFFENLSWIDSFVNAAMILSGMGPLAQPQTDAGKIFAGMYALYSGLAVLLIAGIIFAPAVHRFLHRFHLESKKWDS